MKKNYQFIVITMSNQRKLDLEYQFRKLNIDLEMVKYFDAFTPENCEGFIPENTTSKQKKEISCFRSHIESISLAYNSEPEFSIILEDDANFIKENFISTIEEIINNWDNYVNPCKMVSIGWVPCNNYDHYAKDSHGTKLQINYSHKLMGNFYSVGLQGYIIRKKDLTQLSKMTHKSETYDSMKQNIISYTLSEENVRWNEKKEIEALQNQLTSQIHTPIDYIVNRLLIQTTLFPPLIIETHSTSTIDNNNPYYWNNFFKEHEIMKQLYIFN